MYTVLVQRKKKKKIFFARLEIQDHCKTNATQNMILIRKDKEQGVADEFPSVKTPMLSPLKISVEETNQSEVQALLMYAQVDKTKKTSNTGGAALVRVTDNETFAFMAP